MWCVLPRSIGGVGRAFYWRFSIAILVPRHGTHRVSGRAPAAGRPCVEVFEWRSKGAPLRDSSHRGTIIPKARRRLRRTVSWTLGAGSSRSIACGAGRLFHERGLGLDERGGRGGFGAGAPG